LTCPKAGAAPAASVAQTQSVVFIEPSRPPPFLDPLIILYGGARRRP
jgi:hypothetical protein